MNKKIVNKKGKTAYKMTNDKMTEKPVCILMFLGHCPFAHDAPGYMNWELVFPGRNKQLGHEKLAQKKWPAHLTPKDKEDTKLTHINVFT